ncbi:hypothetical protein [Aureimonas phyllosphaerae]|uniref:Uncharacterized protein n=1 Tax=Aureimonas phyllosphaerae TaxID=1166078 RepID=A0A7W6FWT3_9HYPH|nr:hypothetical protein [Aureimonas phyllosphaerae]MBB3937352.1 hypothetical protein [Aureimonas phyllosphaerae]MBB3961359.1 hypothetical protein [Aureimonas phyllosphaerae]SFF42217.1 hypothetical protein SAMN05216566_11271 [Aureimonas phyllosphaerae]
MEDEFDVIDAFGGEALGDRFAIYIPNKDRHGEPVDQKTWVAEALYLLSDIGGGATAMPPVTGAWVNPQTGQLILEEPVVVYSYVDPDKFVAEIDKVIDFVRRLGRETNQGSVGMESLGTFFTVSNFD